MGKKKKKKKNMSEMDYCTILSQRTMDGLVAFPTSTDDWISCLFDHEYKWIYGTNTAEKCLQLYFKWTGMTPELNEECIFFMMENIKQQNV